MWRPRETFVTFRLTSTPVFIDAVSPEMKGYLTLIIERDLGIWLLQVFGDSNPGEIGSLHTPQATSLAEHQLCHHLCLRSRAFPNCTAGDHSHALDYQPYRVYRHYVTLIKIPWIELLLVFINRSFLL